ncbi:MAG: metal-dependent hydrolase [Vicinamibacterales bacterium]
MGHGIIEKMPSPLGHALGGAIVGSLVARRPGWAVLAVCAAAAALPDVDILLPMRHRGATHSVTAALVGFGAALLLLAVKGVKADRVRLASAVGLAVLSHVLLDWLGEDSSTPRGVMALWPFSIAYYVSDLNVFAAVDRRYWSPGFLRRNTIALARELGILIPLAWLARKGTATFLRKR